MDSIYLLYTAFLHNSLLLKYVFRDTLLYRIILASQAGIAKVIESWISYTAGPQGPCDIPYSADFTWLLWHDLSLHTNYRPDSVLDLGVSEEDSSLTDVGRQEYQRGAEVRQPQLTHRQL